MSTKKQNPKPAPKTFSEAMAEINWGANNGLILPRADTVTYFAGTLPSLPEPEISAEDIALLSEIFRSRQNLF